REPLPREPLAIVHRATPRPRHAVRVDRGAHERPNHPRPARSLCHQTVDSPAMGFEFIPPRSGGINGTTALHDFAGSSDDLVGRLYDRVAAALLWIAAFAFAAGVFFTITLLLGGLPPTEPVAVGLVTIERYSKLKDYVEAALFFLIVPPLTVWLRRAGATLLAREQRRFITRRDM